jgi:hypothetical protein
VLAHDARLLDRDAVHLDLPDGAAGRRPPVESEVDGIAADGDAELELAFEARDRRRDRDAQLVTNVSVVRRPPARQLA